MCWLFFCCFFLRSGIAVSKCSVKSRCVNRLTFKVHFHKWQQTCSALLPAQTCSPMVILQSCSALQIFPCETQSPLWELCTGISPATVCVEGTQHSCSFSVPRVPLPRGQRRFAPLGEEKQLWAAISARGCRGEQLRGGQGRDGEFNRQQFGTGSAGGEMAKKVLSREFP